MIEAIAILILGYAVFKDLLHYKEVRALQVMLLTGEPPKEKEETSIFPGESLDDLIPLDQVEPDKLLKATEKEGEGEK